MLLLLRGVAARGGCCCRSCCCHCNCKQLRATVLLTLLTFRNLHQVTMFTLADHDWDAPVPPDVCLCCGLRLRRDHRYVERARVPVPSVAGCGCRPICHECFKEVGGWLERFPCLACAASCELGPLCSAGCSSAAHRFVGVPAGAVAGFGAVQVRGINGVVFPRVIIDDEDWIYDEDRAEAEAEEAAAESAAEAVRAAAAGEVVEPVAAEASGGA